MAHVVENIRANTVNDHNVVFIVEKHDTESISTGRSLDAQVVINSHKGCYAGAINSGYESTSSEWLFCGDDSLDFHYGWDQIALDNYQNTHLVIGINDMNNPGSMTGTGSTIHLVARIYLDNIGGVIDSGPGSFLNEQYHHYWTDTEFIETAKSRGYFIGCLNAYAQHLHWASGTAPVDDTTHKNEAHIPEDQAIYNSRVHLWS